MTARGRVKSRIIYRREILQNQLAVIKNCFVLLGKKEIQKIGYVAIGQLFLACIDFVGVMAIGLIGTLSVYGIQSRQPSGQLNWVLEFVNISQFTFQVQIAILGSFAGIVLISKSIISAWINRRTIVFLSNRSADISIRILHKLAFSSFEQIRKRSRFENIFAITSGVQSITVGVIGQIMGLFSDFVLITIMFIGLFVVDPSIALVTVALFGAVAFALYKLVNQRVADLATEGTEIQIKNGQALYELFGSYREVFSGGIRLKYLERLAGLRRRSAGVDASSKFVSDVSKYVLEVAFVFGAFFFVGIQFILKDAAGAISSISIFVASAGRIIPAILRVQSAALTFRGAISVADRTLKMIEELKDFEPVHIVDKVKEAKREDFESCIRLRNVSFTYFGVDQEVLKAVNLEVQSGEWLAIVGPSGAGKTTLVDLILGLLKPTQGVVEISGIQAELAVTQWPGVVSYVPQDSFIVQGSIEENVALGLIDDEMDQERIRVCLQKVGLEDLVSKNTMGVKQQVGELGSLLSGGQRQRLGIARALYTKPKLLILDEATSSLDTISEHRIVECLREMKGAVTIVSIAHRLSTVKNADRLIYLEDGEIKASGSFQEIRVKIPNFEKQAQLSNIQP